MNVVVTGAAGFIGYHLCSKLKQKKDINLILIDNLKPSTHGRESQSRKVFLERLNCEVHQIDIVTDDQKNLHKILINSDVIVHLAGFPGVRQGEINTQQVFDNNIIGFWNLLESSHNTNVSKILYASSSSVYGDLGLEKSTSEKTLIVNKQKSFYSTSKYINETLANDFTRRTGIQTIGLRFFTVFGIFGRTDMAYMNFIRRINANLPIMLYGSEGGVRNFTPVEDVVSIIEKLISDNYEIENNSILNVASNEPISTVMFINEISKFLNKKPILEHISRPIVDVEKTHADLTLLNKLLPDIPSSNLSQSISQLVGWYKKLLNDDDILFDPWKI